MIVRIYEAMSDSQKSTLRGYGMDVVESEICSGYELYLLTTGLAKQFYGGVKYNLGLQKEGQDFTNHESQSVFLPFDKLPVSCARLFLKKVKEWVNKYGEIAIKSADDKKQLRYIKILISAGIKIEHRRTNLDFIVLTK